MKEFLKKIMRVLSWISFFVWVSVIGFVSLWCGASVCSFIEETFNLKDFWWCIALVPVLYSVSGLVAYFFLLGIKLVKES